MGQQPKESKKREEGEFVYQVGKIAFAVEAVYHKDGARTVHDAILGLMMVSDEGKPAPKSR